MINLSSTDSECELIFWIFVAQHSYSVIFFSVLCKIYSDFVDLVEAIFEDVNNSEKPSHGVPPLQSQHSLSSQHSLPSQHSPSPQHSLSPYQSLTPHQALVPQQPLSPQQSFNDFQQPPTMFGEEPTGK